MMDDDIMTGIIPIDTRGEVGVIDSSWLSDVNCVTACEHPADAILV